MTSILSSNQFGRQFLEALGTTVGRPILHGKVPAFDITEVKQRLFECE